MTTKETTQKTAAQLDREIEAVIAAPTTGAVSENGGRVYDEVRPWTPTARHRWVGRCKRCGAARRLEGQLASARHARQSDQVIVDDGGLVYMTDELGSNPTSVTVRCGDHWCRLRRVFDDAKPNKRRTECGSRCTQATGPACDCRCRGANHGSGR